MTHQSWQQEEFSRAYLQAVASVAGYATQRHNVDQDGIDLTVHAHGGSGTVRSPRLDVQAKTKTAGKPKKFPWPFALEVDHYEKLRPTDFLVPRILVVVAMPKLVTDWLSISHQQLVLRHCAYWISLRGSPPTTNKDNITVYLEKKRKMSPDELNDAHRTGRTPMKVAVQDVAALRALRPLDVASYLRAHGWEVDGTVDGFTRYVQGSNGNRVDIDVPRGSEYRDFHLRMAEVVDALAHVEKRSQLEILEDLSVASADVIRLRLQGPDVDNGTVTLEDGAAVVDHVRDVMLASACAAVEPRAFYGTRKPTEAMEYVRKLRLGQTEYGSFVVKVLSPVAPLLSAVEAGDLFPESLAPPFERKVTETLMNGARAASQAALDAGAKGTLAPFEHAVPLGSSANLCEGLAGILVDRPFTALEVAVTWSRNRPTPSKVERVVRLTRETAPVLVSAARELKARTPRDDFDLAGYVVQLDNTNVLEHGGTITVAAAVDAGARRVRVALGADDYKKAIEAHKSMARVACSGRLVKSGRQYELKGPSGFAVIGDD